VEEIVKSSMLLCYSEVPNPEYSSVSQANQVKANIGCL